MYNVRTENGAVAVRIDEHVLNFFSRAGAMRGNSEVVGMFARAFSSDPQLAIRAAFWLRDIRGGAGERELFRNILVWLAKNNLEVFEYILQFVPEYGRFDDLVEILDKVSDEAATYIFRYLLVIWLEDVARLYRDDPVTLLGKWMPSVNAGHRSKMLAKRFMQYAGIREINYRKTLSALRAKIDVVERKMSAQQWNDINYAAVPSRANKLYSNAFIRHGSPGYIENLAKIKSDNVQPYELYQQRDRMDDRVLEAMWSNLPDYIGDNSILVMADVSGSMEMYDKGLPMDVSVSTALYAATKGKGPFKNTFMTFSSQPTIITVKPGPIRSQFQAIKGCAAGTSTNLTACFDLLLDRAVKHGASQEDMPKFILVVSDMEFDEANRSDRFTPKPFKPMDATNYQAIVAKFTSAGYSIPTIVFWNVHARNNQAPVNRDELGTILISGLSTTTFKNVLSLNFDYTETEDKGVVASITPMEAMLQILNGERYSRISFDQFDNY